MRRWLILLWLALAPLIAGAGQLPILMVHGNGDSAALWLTTIWRFESNGYDPALLDAIDFAHPNARDADGVAQVNRSSAEDERAALAAAVDALLAKSGQRQLVLIGSSRGGNAIRNFIRHDEGHRVALAILCGTPNHGVFRLPYRLDFEFNGLGPFLRGLNHPPGGHGEVDDGVKFVTLRSDHNDKFAQPTGRYLGLPHVPTFVWSDGPALDGADNIVLPGLDHREVAFHRPAFAEIYRAVTGHSPDRLDPLPEAAPVLSGVISGFDNGAPTNLPLPGASLEIYQVDPASGERRGDAQWRQQVGADGRWGPFAARPDAFYEFVVTAAGYPLTHVFRTPFPRSSRYVHFRLEPAAPAREVGAVVTLTRPRGYFGKGRDVVLIDGKPPAALPDGIPSIARADQTYPPGAPRSVPVQFNDEKMTVRTFPAAEGHRVVAEMQY